MFDKYLIEIQTELLYRYEDSKGRGIMSDYYYRDNKRVPDSIFQKLTWLPKPPKYDKTYISYFTELGNKKFIETAYKDFKKYIPDMNVIKIRKDKVKNISYSDEYQVIGKKDIKIMSFPKEEIPIIRKELMKGKIQSTVRVGKEYNKYHEGEVYRFDSKILIEIIEVIKAKSIEEYKYYSELSETKKKYLSKFNKLDFIDYRKI